MYRIPSPLAPYAETESRKRDETGGRKPKAGNRKPKAKSRTPKSRRRKTKSENNPKTEGESRKPETESRKPKPKAESLKPKAESETNPSPSESLRIGTPIMSRKLYYDNGTSTMLAFKKVLFHHPTNISYLPTDFANAPRIT